MPEARQGTAAEAAADAAALAASGGVAGGCQGGCEAEIWALCDWFALGAGACLVYRLLCVGGQSHSSS